MPLRAPFFAADLAQVSHANPGTANSIASSTAGRLLQHFVCDAWIACESSDLNWIRKNQKTIRADTYHAVQEAQANGATTGAEAGKQRIVLPSSHAGGPRYMKQLYQDAIALSSKFGRPDLFTTFTCNPKWREITENLLPGEKARDRPDFGRQGVQYEAEGSDERYLEEEGPW